MSDRLPSFPVDWIAVSTNAIKHAYRKSPAGVAFRSTVALCGGGPHVAASVEDKGDKLAGSRKCTACKGLWKTKRVEKAEQQLPLFGGSWGR
jgi:hypothetical protein